MFSWRQSAVNTVYLFSLFPRVCPFCCALALLCPYLLDITVFPLWSAALTGRRWVSEGRCRLGKPHPRPVWESQLLKAPPGLKTTCVRAHTYTHALCLFGVVWPDFYSDLLHCLLSAPVSAPAPRAWVVASFVLFVGCTHLFVWIYGKTDSLLYFKLCLSLSTNVPFSVVPMW